MTTIQNQEMDGDWCEVNIGRSVIYDGQQGTLSGYGPSDGLWWGTVDLDDGSQAEVLLSELALPDDGRW